MAKAKGASRVVVNPWNLPFIRPGLLPGLALQPQLSLALNLNFTYAVTTSGLPPALTPATTESVRALDLLLCMGLASTSATSASELSAWGPLLEYATAVRHLAGEFRVTEAVRGWDSRQKGVFSERLGQGFAAWLLWNRLDVRHIADADFFIGRVLGQPGSPYDAKGLRSLGLYGKTGKLKPDYFCLSRGNEAVIAESKGAFGPPSAVSAGERRKAKNQTKNVQATGVAERVEGNRLVIASTIRYDQDPGGANAKGTAVRIEDPPPSEDAIHVPVSPEDLALAGYAKAFCFFGMPHVGMGLLQGMRPAWSEFEPPEPIQLGGDLSMIPLGHYGSLNLGVIKEVMDALTAEAPLPQVLPAALTWLDERLGEAEGHAVDAAAEELWSCLPNGVAAKVA